MRAELELTRLNRLMELTGGVARVVLALIDGPVLTSHPDLEPRNLRVLRDAPCDSASPPCRHGTFVAGMLAGRRGSVATAICPGCTLLVRPIFHEPAQVTCDGLAMAIAECLDAGARIVNLSAALDASSFRGRSTPLTSALDRAASAGTLIVASAGNRNTTGATNITQHPWVLPVAGCGEDGRPVARYAYSPSIGRKGLLAPGENITGLSLAAGAVKLSGTSFAAPFVTGAAALLWSLHPSASAIQVRTALAGSQRRTSVVPPLLDAWSAHQALSGRGNRHG